MNYIKIQGKHEEIVIPMVKEFYSSDAVDHAVEGAILEQTFRDACDDSQAALWGYLMEDQGETVGFFYLTSFYACEMGGMCLMIEEIFIKNQHRGKGYGKKAFEWIHETYPQYKRFRLEVTDSNEGAIKLYEALGYRRLGYGQMVRDEEKV